MSLVRSQILVKDIGRIRLMWPEGLRLVVELDFAELGNKGRHLLTIAIVLPFIILADE
jgi:hypothetical protein